jgi:5S rRNA maturation endonuclease (ribonuclease M5)
MSGLYDHVGPSILAQDLTLVVRRLRKQTGLDVVPMVVVEGPSDETMLARVCNSGAKQVFAAGTRGLVEQLLVHLRDEPIPGCECIFITDCDGTGKAMHLKTERGLVVTENCDAEADLVAVGVASDVVAQVLQDDEQAAQELLANAVDLGMVTSRVRRAAAKAGVTFKRRRETRLGLCEILAEMSDDESLLTVADVLCAVQRILSWSADDSKRVEAELPSVPNDFRLVCSGKDVLDAVWHLLKQEGRGRDLTRDGLHRQVRSGLQLRHMAGWVVAERLWEWQRDVGCELIPR